MGMLTSFCISGPANNTQVVFVIMLLSSLAFYVMAWSVPVVSHTLESANSHSNSRIAKATLPPHHGHDYHLCGHLILRHGNW